MTDALKANPFPNLAQIDPDGATEPFWDAAREHRFVMQRCGSCHTFRHPPVPFCHNCLSGEIEWVDLPGTGTVYSYTIVNYTISPDVPESELPYVVAIVELDGTGGQKHIGNLVGEGALDVAVGQRVAVVWDDVPDHEVTVPRFQRVTEP
jgi:uncharacterized OB-fold protein